jgi:hypothetical protein
MTDTIPEAAHAASEYDDDARGEQLPEGAAICGFFCALVLLVALGAVAAMVWRG